MDEVESFRGLNQRQVPISRPGGSNVRGGIEDCLAGKPAGQVAEEEGLSADDAHVQLPETGEDSLPGAPAQQIEAKLDHLHLFLFAERQEEGFALGMGCGEGDPVGANDSPSLELLQGGQSRGLVEADLGGMQDVDVDIVRSQPLQRILVVSHDVIAGVVAGIAPILQEDPHLGGDDDLLPPVLNDFAHQALGMAVAVPGSRVQEVDSPIEGMPEHRQRLGVVHLTVPGDGPVPLHGASDPPAPQAHDRDFHSGPAQPFGLQTAHGP